jgi:AraC family transcriptional regulator
MTIVVSSAGYILHEKARTFEGEGTGWLSIKSFSGGCALYRVGRNHYAVDEERYLLLNQGQEYGIQIESHHPVESLCVFFRPGLVEAVRQAFTMPDDHLLDAPITEAPLNFFEKTYPHDEAITPFLDRLSMTYASAAKGWLEEQFYELVGRLLQVHFNVYKDVERLPAARPATREELYRRLHYARDYAAALFHQPITLDDLASVACLSPNHLLRTFKSVFGQTPHQFITALRLEEAQRLLRTTRQPVTGICFAVGFESLGTFSWLFHRRFGLSPSHYRQQTGDFEEVLTSDCSYNATTV